MFGFKRKKPMTLTPFAEARPKSFNAVLCDGLTVRGAPSFAALLDLHASLQAERPGLRVLVTLDNRIQAEYTSGHATDVHDLDDVTGHDLSFLDEAAFENGEHRGYLSTPAEFPIRVANLLARARDVQLAQAVGLLAWETSGDANDLVTVNRDPETALRIDREAEILVQFVPVASGALALAAFPNGYFASDLNPMQTYALAQRLEAEYGLALFGVGAAFLGFRRPGPLDEATARALAEDLAGFYAASPSDAAARLAGLLAGRDWLLVRYTES
ncbi:hypothetical protein CFHF_15070 [Caulobacter flavus]|uniref:DUF4253 domain-containing protein n=1 Tax=Caulobacter flavus TaxID=1679497 RepID=A0A2N5CS13_9CAUL|nr:hypothetical protein [Caulobacter flavus]AYV46457.1 hypothetical protein C1707_09385 [Caulobacter flavus]PLR12755.1 hypothetical protein CFHF_15070 [Caulobacter flavus]